MDREKQRRDLEIETDLLTPIAQIDLQVEHTIIDYAPVEFPKRHARLWLPQDTAVYLAYRRHHYETTHHFSEFKLFSVDSAESIKGPTVDRPDPLLTYSGRLLPNTCDLAGS